MNATTMLLAAGAIAFLGLAQVQAAQPVNPQACGQDAGPWLIKAWKAADGAKPGEAVTTPGVSAVEEAADAYAARAFSFEAWVRWPEEAAQGFKPETVAESYGGDWWWRLNFDEWGQINFAWRNGQDFFAELRTDRTFDIIRPGVWYHVAVVFFDRAWQAPTYANDSSQVAIYFTEAGKPVAEPWLMSREVKTPGPGPQAPAQFAVGRPLNPTPEEQARGSLMRIGSAAYYTCVNVAGDFPALGGAKAPQGIAFDGEFDGSSLGHTVATSDTDIVFTPALHNHSENYWFAFRARGVKGKTLNFYCPLYKDMLRVAYISEDGGKTWGRPSGGLTRAAFADGTNIAFTHSFASDEAIIAGCPLTATSMVSDWVDAMAKKPGVRVYEVGKSPAGIPLRVVEVGNHDAPFVYIQIGQHSMYERMGFHMVSKMFEAALEDAQPLGNVRWLLMPTVNVDSYLVAAKMGDDNMNRIWGTDATHATVLALQEFLGKEAARTGSVFTIDMHAGMNWRRHTFLGGGETFRLMEQCMKAAGLEFEFRDRGSRTRPSADQADAPAVPRRSGAGGYFATLPGNRLPATIELAILTMPYPNGIGPVTFESYLTDGPKLYEAFKSFVKEATRE